MNDGSWKCLSHQLLVCCLLTFIAITLTSAHFDPAQVYGSGLLQSPYNIRICHQNWANPGLKRFSSRSKNFLQLLKWANSKENHQTLPNAVKNLNFRSLRGLRVLQKLPWSGCPASYFLFLCHQALSNSSEQPASANTVAHILPPPNTKPHYEQPFESWEGCTKAGLTHINNHEHSFHPLPLKWSCDMEVSPCFQGALGCFGCASVLVHHQRLAFGLPWFRLSSQHMSSTSHVLWSRCRKVNVNTAEETDRNWERDRDSKTSWTWWPQKHQCQKVTPTHFRLQDVQGRWR